MEISTIPRPVRTSTLMLGRLRADGPGEGVLQVCVRYYPAAPSFVETELGSHAVPGEVTLLTVAEADVDGDAFQPRWRHAVRYLCDEDDVEATRGIALDFLRSHFELDPFVVGVAYVEEAGDHLAEPPTEEDERRRYAATLMPHLTPDQYRRCAGDAQIELGTIGSIAHEAVVGKRAAA